MYVINLNHQYIGLYLFLALKSKSNDGDDNDKTVKFNHDHGIFRINTTVTYT